MPPSSGGRLNFVLHDGCVGNGRAGGEEGGHVLLNDMIKRVAFIRQLFFSLVLLHAKND